MYTDWILKNKESKVGKTLEERVVELLTEQNLTVTTAESCTGGLIAAALINVPGASEVLNEGYITYSNEAKIRLVGVFLGDIGTIWRSQFSDSKRNGRGCCKNRKSRCGIKCYRNRRTRRWNRRKAGRSCIYRVFCERADNGKKMYIQGESHGKQTPYGRNSLEHVGGSTGKSRKIESAD